MGKPPLLWQFVALVSYSNGKKVCLSSLLNLVDYSFQSLVLGDLFIEELLNTQVYFSMQRYLHTTRSSYLSVIFSLHGQICLDTKKE